MQPSEIAAQIRAVKAKLQNERAWVKNAMFAMRYNSVSKNREYRGVAARSGERGIDSWDLLGAFVAVTGKQKYPWEAAPYMLRAIAEMTGKPLGLTEFNDKAKHHEVLAMLGIAAVHAEKQVCCYVGIQF